jgi:sorting nexin-25
MPNEPMQRAVNQIVNYISRDYLRAWYRNISLDPTWLNRTEVSIHSILAELFARLSKIDFVQFIVGRIFPILISHIQHFKQAEALLRAGSKKLSNVVDPNQDELLLAKHYRLGKLHPAVTGQILNTKEQECKYLRETAKKIVPFLLPKSEASSGLVSIFVRELLASTLLQPIVESYSDPDYINQSFEMVVDQLSEQVQPE